jgi:hypothetical protein
VVAVSLVLGLDGDDVDIKMCGDVHRGPLTIPCGVSYGLQMS